VQKEREQVCLSLPLIIEGGREKAFSFLPLFSFMAGEIEVGGAGRLFDKDSSLFEREEKPPLFPSPFFRIGKLRKGMLGADHALFFPGRVVEGLEDLSPLFPGGLGHRVVKRPSHESVIRNILSFSLLLLPESGKGGFVKSSERVSRVRPVG